MENKQGYEAKFRKCNRPKPYLNKMYNSIRDKMSFFILEMKTSEIRIFRHEYINALAREISQAEDFIYVISGELSSNIWNSSKVINAILKTNAKSIKIICGPEIDLNSIEMLKLVKSGKIDLYFSKKRYKKHFMVTDKTVFLEKGHRSFDFSDEILMTRKDASYMISLYKNKFAAKIMFKKQISVEEILQNFSPRVFKRDAKENNKEPTQEEIDDFIRKLGL